MFIFHHAHNSTEGRERRLFSEKFKIIKNYLLSPLTFIAAKDKAFISL